jgi:hypothetical protein
MKVWRTAAAVAGVLSIFPVQSARAQAAFSRDVAPILHKLLRGTRIELIAHYDGSVAADGAVTGEMTRLGPQQPSSYTFTGRMNQ